MANYKPTSMQQIQTVNKVFMAYFLNAIEGQGINLMERKIDIDLPKEYSHNIQYEYKGKVAFVNRSPKELGVKSIRDFMDDEIKEALDKEAKQFADCAKNYPDGIIAFPMLPQADPYPCCIDFDDETLFSARTIYSHDLMTDKDVIVFNYQAIFADKPVIIT